MTLALRFAAALACATLALSACDGGRNNQQLTPRDGDAARYTPSGQRIPLQDWQPIPRRAVSPETQLARDTILGPNAIEDGKVKLWWFGVSSFVISGGGHLWLMDAWEPIGLQADYVPVGREEIAAIQPEAIFIGHGHFDHAADAGYIAGRSGAVVVGSEEICTSVQADAAQDDLQNAFDCLITGTATLPAPGTTQTVELWNDMAAVSILQHIHSAASPQTYELGDTPFIHVPNLLPYLGYLNSSPEEWLRFLSTLTLEQGGTWAYHFKLGDFTMLWHDSTGPIVASDPDGAAVQAALDSFPGCVDVQLGAIVGFDQPISGLRDPRLYVEHAHPRVFLPNHHDAWAPVVGGGAAAYKSEWQREMDSLENPPLVDYLTDPVDYMAPRVYDIKDPIWAEPMPGSRCAGE